MECVSRLFMAIDYERTQPITGLEGLAQGTEFFPDETENSSDRLGVEPTPSVESILEAKYSPALQSAIEQVKADRAQRVDTLLSGDLDGGAYQERSWARGALAAFTVVGALGALAFEQSPANEAMRAAAGLNVLERTHNELIVGSTVAGITMAIEGVSSSLIALGLHQRRDTVRRLVGRFKGKKRTADAAESLESEPSKDAVTKVTNIGIALGVGAGFVVTKQHLQDNDPTLQRDLSTGLKASALVAGVSGAIGVLASGGIEHADKVGLGTAAEYFVDYATDWKFWLGVVGVAQGAVWARNKLRRGDRRVPTALINPTPKQEITAA